MFVKEIPDRKKNAVRLNLHFRLNFGLVFACTAKYKEALVIQKRKKRKLLFTLYYDKSRCPLWSFFIEGNVIYDSIVTSIVSIVTSHHQPPKLLSINHKNSEFCFHD